MNGAGLFFLLLFLLVIIPAAGFIGFTRWNAHRRGLPPPPLSAYIPFKKSSSSSRGVGGGSGGGGGGGPINWVKDKISSLRDHRAGSGYAGQTRGSRGFGPLDPDAAWDDRVALEADGVDEYGYGGHGGAAAGGAGGRGRDRDRAGGAYGYEEQELGMHGPASPRDHGPYGMHTGGGGGGGGGGLAMPAYGEEPRGRSRSREDLRYYNADSIGRHELDARYEETMHGSSGGGASGGLRGLSPRPAEDPNSKHERRSIFREEA